MYHITTPKMLNKTELQVTTGKNSKTITLNLETRHISIIESIMKCLREETVCAVCEVGWGWCEQLTQRRGLPMSFCPDGSHTCESVLCKSILTCVQACENVTLH